MTAELDAQVLLDRLKRGCTYYGVLRKQLCDDPDRTIDAIDLLLNKGLAERISINGITAYQEGPSCRAVKRKIRQH